MHFEPTVVADFDSSILGTSCTLADAGAEIHAHITTGAAPSNFAYGRKDVFGAAGGGDLWIRCKVRILATVDVNVAYYLDADVLRLLDVDLNEILRLRVHYRTVEATESLPMATTASHATLEVTGAFGGSSVPIGPELNGDARTIELYYSPGNVVVCVLVDGEVVVQGGTRHGSAWAPAVAARYVDFGLVEAASNALTSTAIDVYVSDLGIRDARADNWYGINDAGKSVYAHTGFEHGQVLTDWANDELETAEGVTITGSPTIDSGTARGGFSVKFDTLSDPTAKWMLFGSGVNIGEARVSTLPTPQACASLYINVEDLPDADVRLFGFTVAPPLTAATRYLAAGGIVLDKYGNLYGDANGGDGSRTFGCCIAAHLSEWIHIEVGVDVSGDNWTLVWRVNGIEMPGDLAVPGGNFPLTGVNLYGFAFGVCPLNNLDAPFPAPPKTIVYFDDIAVSRSVADYPLGPISHSLKVPNGVGTHVKQAQFAYTTDNLATTTPLAADTTSYQKIDEWPANFSATADGVTPIGATSGGFTDVDRDAHLEYTLADTGSDPIAVAFWKARHPHSGVFPGRPALSTGLATHRKVWGSGFGSDGVVYACVPRTPTGVPWTQAIWNAILFQFGWQGSHDATGSPLLYLLDSVGFELLLVDSELAALPDATLVECNPPAPTDPGGELGCGEYQVSLWSRGLKIFEGVIPYAQVEFDRTVNETTNCVVTVDGLATGGAISEVLGTDCSGVVAFAYPWIGELAVFRRNSALEWIREWSGPILKLTIDAEAERATIEARDLSAWWDRRRIHSNHIRGRRDPLTDVYSQVDDVATLFKRYADDAMAPDNTPGVVVPTVVVGVSTIKPVRRSEFRIAADVLRELADAGVDWALVDRTVLLGVNIPGLTIGPILPHHLAAAPVFAIDGSQQTNDIVVKGEGAGPAGVSVNSLPDSDGVTEDSSSILSYGLLEAVVTSKVSTRTQANADAQSRLALAAFPLTIVEQVRLLPSAPFPLATLLPGVAADLHVGTAPAVQRIHNVHVVKTRGEEQVVLTFEPPGTTE